MLGKIALVAQWKELLDSNERIGSSTLPESACVPIAQLDRASVFGTDCWRFDSSWARLVKLLVFINEEEL